VKPASSSECPPGRRDAATRPRRGIRKLGAARRFPDRHQHGFTLIDVLLVIVLLGIVAAALTATSARLASQSSHTLKSRQALALAQGLLDEVRHMPFTYCDPSDARAALATGAFVGGTGCAAQVDALGPEPGESRYNAANRFDGVTDYQGFVMPGPGCAAGLCDAAGNVVNATGALVGCAARVDMAAQALPGIVALDANGRPQALRIVVTATCPGIEAVYAEGIRVRHAPNRL
jgi:MSHA pilin protein MshD